MDFETARNMMGGSVPMMMILMWLSWLLFIVLAILGIVALWKYINK
jgi:hypothetical protein